MGDVSGWMVVRREWCEWVDDNQTWLAVNRWMIDMFEERRGWCEWVDGSQTWVCECVDDNQTWVV